MISSPSLSDFGTHDESRHPELWDNCAAAFAPCLGPSGAKIYDWSGTGSYVVLTNVDISQRWVVVDGKYSMQFTGGNSIGEGFDLPQYEPRSRGTVSCWVRPTLVTSFMGYFGKRLNSSVNSPWQLDTNSASRFRFFIANGATTNQAVATSFTVSVGVLYHLCGRWNGSNVELFINGVAVATASQTVDPQTGTGAIYFSGNRNVSNTIVASPLAYVDDARYYHRSLTDSEIRLLASDRGVAYQRRRRRSYFAEQITPAFRASWIKKPSQLIGGGTY